jgi:hypothetical protein
MKKANPLPIFALFLLSLALTAPLMACSVFGGSETPTAVPQANATSSASTSAATTAVETAAPTVAATATNPPPTARAVPTNTPLPTPVPISLLAAQESEQPQTQAPLPPFSLVDFLQEQTEEGEPISGQAIVQVLKLILGQLSVDDMVGLDELTGEGGTGVLAIAHEYLQREDADPDMQAEVARLLEIVAPSQEKVEAYAMPAEEARSGRAAGLAAVQAGVDCQNQWLQGLPNEGVANCFLYNQAELVGHTYRVYYPTAWNDFEEMEPFYAGALDAVIDSAVTYGQYGTVEDATVIFSQLPYSDNDGTGFMAVPFHRVEAGEPCPLLIYTNALGANVGPDNFKQAVAHEMFHCYQAWNYPEVKQNYNTNAWWGEGGAEYFSNLVYPSTDFEHRVLKRFNVNSRNQSILEMDYENGVFFQYLANHAGGPEGVLRLFDSLPIAADRTTQAQALANFDNMPELFHNLGLALLSSTDIADPGGQPLVVEHPAVTGRRPIQEKGTYDFSSRPFVLTRYVLAYEQEKRFDQNVQSGENGRYSTNLVKERRDLSTWSELPQVVLGKCEEDTKYVILMTTTDVQDYELELEVTKVEEATCDPCVLGTWDVDNENFGQYLDTMMNQDTAGTGVEFAINSVSGRLFVTFDEERKMSIGSESFQTTISVPAVSQTIVVDIRASGTGTYHADGETINLSNIQTGIEGSNETGTSTLDVSGNTAVLQLPLNNLFGYGTALGAGVPINVEPKPVSYVCSEEQLQWTPEGLPTVLLNRVEEIPPTPQPTPVDSDQ